MNAITIPDRQLTENFRLYEFLRSATAEARGIDNTPPQAIEAALEALAVRMEDVRGVLGDNSVAVSSGYRCPLLNSAVGSKPTSDHVKGLAADFTCAGFGTVVEVCHRIESSDIKFKQLILEGPTRARWVHISFDLQAELQGLRARRQVLTIGKGGETIVGIHEEALA